jgi:hypothetical protein
MQNILRREAEINQELKALHSSDLEDMQSKMQQTIQDKDKWERLARSNLHFLVLLSKRDDPKLI